MIIALLIIICIVVALIWFTAKMDSNIEASFTPSGKLTPVDGGIIHWQKQGNGPYIPLIVQAADFRAAIKAHPPASNSKVK